MTQPLYVQPLKTLTFTAAEALEAHRLVIIDPTDTTHHSCRYPEADGDTQLVGITMHAAASGADVEVVVAGIFPLKVDGGVANIAWGDFISAHDTDGYGRKRTAVTAECIGQAMGSSTTDGDEISIRIALQGG